MQSNDNKVPGGAGRGVPKYKARKVHPLAIAFILETEYGTLMYSSQDIDQAQVILQQMDLPAKYAQVRPGPVMIAGVLLAPTIHPVQADDMVELVDSGLMVPGRVWSRIIQERTATEPSAYEPKITSIRAGASRNKPSPNIPFIGKPGDDKERPL